MKVKVLRDFIDKRGKCRRRAGEELETTPERLAEINGAGYGALVEAVEDKKGKPKDDSKE